MLKIGSLSISLLVMMLVAPAFSQTVRPNRTATGLDLDAPTAAIDSITNDVGRMARSLDVLSRSWGDFTKTFSTNQGLQLDDKQKKLLLALEVLNRFEASLANLQRLKFDLSERQTRTSAQVATTTDALLPESIDRYVGQRGTTNAEAMREARRQTLQKQLRDQQALLQQVTRDLDVTLEDIRRLEGQIRALRNQIFGELDRQLADL